MFGTRVMRKHPDEELNHGTIVQDSALTPRTAAEQGKTSETSGDTSRFTNLNSVTRRMWF